MLVLHGVPSHKTREQAASMGLRWWRVVANQAAGESAMRFGFARQLEPGVMRLAAEAAEIERLA